MMQTNHNNIIEALSSQRMATYRALTPNGTDEETIKLAQWDDLVCNALWGEIRIFEIILRNTIAKRLKEIKFPKSDIAQWWMQIEYFKKNYPHAKLGEMLEFASKQLHCKKKETEGHFIAELPLGFWCGCLTQRLYHFLWHGKLKLFFPHLEMQPKSKNQTKNEAEKEALRKLHQKINKLREKLRNPIGHHHPFADKQKLITNQLKTLYDIIDYIDPSIRQIYCKEDDLRKLLASPPFPLKNNHIK